jgi:hypothetical protein
MHPMRWDPKDYTQRLGHTATIDIANMLPEKHKCDCHLDLLLSRLDETIVLE